MHLSVMQGLPCLPSFLCLFSENNWKAYSLQSDSKSIEPGRIKDRQAFLWLSRAISAVFTDASTPFHTRQQPLPLENMTKGNKSQDNGRIKAIRHSRLILLLDIHHLNKTFQSAWEPTDTSIMHWEHVGEPQEGESHPMVEVRQWGHSACQGIGL